MLQRMVHLLLVAAFSSSGASAPFLHVHAHGPGYGGAVDEHCAHHHAEGAHWHPPGNPAPDARSALAASGAGHRHAAVSLSAVAIETPSTDTGAPSVLFDAPENGVAPRPAGPCVPVSADAGPDPPPLPLPATRGPPARA